MNLRWCCGLVLIMIGLYFMTEDKEKQEKEIPNNSTPEQIEVTDSNNNTSRNVELTK